MKVAFEPTTDLERVRQILTEPRCWAQMANDHSVDPQAIQVPEGPQHLYLLAKHAGCTMGLVMLSKRSLICCEMHTSMLPWAWGDLVYRAAIGILPWIWENTEYLRVISYVAERNRLALRVAKTAGLDQWGTNAGSIMRGGILESEIWLGASRPVA